MSTQRDESVPVRAVRLKLRNRRIEAGQLKCGDIVFRFRILEPGKRLIRHQTIRLTPEAVAAMYAGMLRLEAMEWEARK